MSTFTRTSNGKVLYTDDDGDVFGLNPNSYVLPHPQQDSMVVISSVPNAQSPGDDGFAIRWADVTDPSGSADRNAFIQTLSENYFFSAGGSGGGIDPNHIFDSEAARDAYFTTNLDELVTNMQIIVTVGSDPEVQRWLAGSNPPSYDANNFVADDTTSLTPEQIITITTLRGITDKFIPVKNGLNAYENSPLKEESDRLVSTKSIEVPPGTVYLGEGTALGGSVNALNVRSLVTGDRAILLSQRYNNTGFFKPVIYEISQASEQVVLNTGSDFEDSFQFQFTTTKDELIYRVQVETNTISSNVNFNIFIRTVSHTGTIIYQLEGILSTDGSGNAIIELDNALLIDNNTDLYITVNSTGIKGSIITTDFIPNFTIFRLPANAQGIASEEWVQANEKYLTGLLSNGKKLTATIANDLDIEVTNPIYDDTFEPTGFVNRIDSSLYKGVSPNFNRIHLDVVATDYEVYIKGEKHTITANKFIDIATTEGLHYIYMDSDENLQETTTFDLDTIFKNNAYLSVVYWDATNSKIIYIGDERHGVVMDWATHSYLHNNFGARFDEGLGLFGFSVDGDGSLDAHAQFQYEAGKIYDEDLAHSILTSSNPAQIPVYYRDGASNIRRKEPDNFPLIGAPDITTTTRAKYNLFNAGTWSLAEVTQNDFFLVHFFATNDLNNKVIGWVGTQLYLDLIAARTGANSEINNLTGLPFAEFVPLGTVIYQTGTSATNTPKAVVRSTDTGSDYIDFRGGATYVGSVNPSDHQNLTNRNATNSHPGTAIQIDNTGRVGLGTTAQSGLAANFDSIANHEASNTAHDAEDLDFDATTSDLTQTKVQGAIVEVQTNLDDHESETTGAHNASAIAIDNTGRTELGANSQTGVEYNYDEIEGHKASVTAHNSTSINFSHVDFTATNAKAAIVENNSNFVTHEADNTAHNINVNAQSNTYYVDSNGVDTGNTEGSIKYPFQTIAKALTIIGNNSLVELQSQTYSESLTISTAGVKLHGVGCNDEIASTSILGSVILSSTGVCLQDVLLNPTTDVVTLSNTTNISGLSISHAYLGQIVSATSNLIEFSDITGTIITKDSSLSGNLDISGTSTADIFIHNQLSDNFTITNNTGASIYLINSKCESINNSGSGNIYIIGDCKTSGDAKIAETGSNFNRIESPYIVDYVTTRLNSYVDLATDNQEITGIKNFVAHLNATQGLTVSGTFTANNAANIYGTTILDGLTTISNNLTITGDQVVSGDIDARNSDDIRLGSSDRLRLDSNGAVLNTALYLDESGTMPNISGKIGIGSGANYLFSVRGDGDVTYLDNWRYISASGATFNAEVYDRILVNTTSNNVQINLPGAPGSFNPVEIISKIGANNLTVDGNGKSIDVFDSTGALIGTDTSIVTTLNKQWLFRYNSTSGKWELHT